MTNQKMTEISIKVEVQETTVLKLRAYLLLSGKSIEELEEQVSNIFGIHLSKTFDGVLTQNLMSTIASMDGFEAPFPGQELTAPVPGAIPKRSFVSAAEAAALSPMDGNEHALSGDDDLGNNKSLEEQVEEDKKIAATPAEAEEQEARRVVAGLSIQVPDAGDDAEAFLDAAIAAPAREREQRQSGTSAAKKAFSSPRVKISETTEDEDSGSTPSFGF